MKTTNLTIDRELDIYCGAIKSFWIFATEVRQSNAQKLNLPGRKAQSAFATYRRIKKTDELQTMKML